MFEYNDKKYRFTLIMEKIRGKIRINGVIRIHNTETGETVLRPGPSIDNSMFFDDIQFVDELTDENGDLGMTRYTGDWIQVV